MQETIQAIILGIIQGASEFLPISSSGHLYLVPEVLGWEGVVDSLSFDVALHVGTMVAVVIFFWRDWWTLSMAFLKRLPQGPRAVWDDIDSRLLVLILIGSVPAAVFGLLLEDFFEEEARNLWLVASTLIIFGIVLFIADRVGSEERHLTGIQPVDAALIGLAQAMALIPGVSRSGVTISTALFRGFDRYSATRFSFLLSTPAIVGATLLKSKDILDASEASADVFIAGAVAAFISGFIAIRFLMRYVQTHNFNIFVAYRIVLGLVVLATAAFR